MAASYLKTQKVRVHVMCAPQTMGVDEVGGEGPITYVVSFPRVLQEVKYLVPGCTSVVHNALRTPRAFHVPPLLIQGGSGPRGGGTAAPL